jgi:hypothetical protein
LLNDCAHCESLLRTALKASKTYHDLLGVLEAAHIRHDLEHAFLIQDEIAEALLSRDEAIAALSEHERVHAKGSTTGM